MKRIFLCVFVRENSNKNKTNLCHFRGPNSKNFPGEHAPGPPRGHRLRRAFIRTLLRKKTGIRPRQRYARKCNDAKNPAIFRFCLLPKRTQLNATHAHLLEKLRPIALAETCRFLTIQSLEFQEIWQKNRSETT